MATQRGARITAPTPVANQKSVDACSTIVSWAHWIWVKSCVDAQKGVITEIKNYSTKYLTPAENQRIVEASNDLIAKLLEARKR